MLRPTLFAVFDTVRDELTLRRAGLAAGRRSPPPPRWARARGARWRRRGRPPRAADGAASVPPVALPAQPEPGVQHEHAPQFEAIVERMQEYITAGDAFQVVPSQRFSAPFALPPFALYRALRRVNPAPFMFFLDFGGFASWALAGDPRPAARRHHHAPAARRHPRPRRHPRGGSGARAGPHHRPQGAGRASDAARSRPQRRGPGRRDRHACASPRASPSSGSAT